MTTPWKHQAAGLGELDGSWRGWANNLAHKKASSISSPAASRIFMSKRSQLHFAEYLGAELSWGKALSWDRRRGRADHVINFLRVPVKLEPFLSFGHAVCVDLFLFHFTYLPLRFFLAIGHGALALLTAGRFPAAFTRGHAFDVLKGTLILIAVWALGAVQVSRVYHYIRGEAIIKLYVIFNILEIFDKLACSLGQDVLDALYRTLRDHVGLDDDSGHKVQRLSKDGLGRLLLHFAAAVVYVVAHSLILFVQTVCLNVAINSRNNALLTLLISNNFVELKGSVFKRFEAENLFQVSCADIVERFQMSLFLGLIALQEFSSKSMLMALLPSMIGIFLCEVLVDYLKHSFIGKFNRLHSDLYSTFSAIISHDIVSTRTKLSSSLDPTHVCVKRLGLPTIPLTVVVCRIILLKVAPTSFPRFDIGEPLGLVVYAVAGCCLFAAKILLGMLLQVQAAKNLRHKR